MRRRLLVAFFVGLLLCASVSVLAQEQPVVESRVKPILEIDGLLFRDLNANGELDPYEDWRLPIDERVDNLVSLMTLEEKAGQMVHPNITVPLDGVVQKEDIITQTQRGERLSYSPYTLIVDKHITNILNNGVAPPQPLLPGPTPCRRSPKGPGWASPSSSAPIRGTVLPSEPMSGEPNTSRSGLVEKGSTDWLQRVTWISSGSSAV